MGVTQCFIMALKSLSTSKMRAFLTMLGIIIGVAAVILIMSLGNGMTIYINDMFAEMGTTTINVMITGRGSTRTVDADDMYEFYEENTDSYSYVSPLVSASGQVRTSVDSETYMPVHYRCQRAVSRRKTAGACRRTKYCVHGHRAEQQGVRCRRIL